MASLVAEDREGRLSAAFAIGGSAGNNARMWIELARKSVFTRAIACASDEAHVAGYSFQFVKGRLTGRIADRTLIETDGGSFVTTDGHTYRVRSRWLQMVALESPSTTLLVEWDVETASVKCQDRPNLRYVITNHSAPVVFKTRTRIQYEGQADEFDFHIALGCVSFFWTFFEKDRTTTS